MAGGHRVDGRFRRVDETRQGSFPSSALVSVLPGVRSEYNLNADYRATDHLSFTVGVDGNGLPGQDFIHTTRLELRAYF